MPKIPKGKDYNYVGDLIPDIHQVHYCLMNAEGCNYTCCRDPLVEAADMTSTDLGSRMSHLVAAKKRMREEGMYALHGCTTKAS